MIDPEHARRLIAEWPGQLQHEWEASQRWKWCKQHAVKYGKYSRRVYPPLSDAPKSALKPYPGTPPFILVAWGGCFDAPEGWMIIEAAKYDKLSARKKRQLFPNAVIFGGGSGGA